MAPDADATAGPPQGWHDLEAVLAEEPVAALLATYLALPWHFRRVLRKSPVAVWATIRNRRRSEQLGDDGAADLRQRGLRRWPVAVHLFSPAPQASSAGVAGRRRRCRSSARAGAGLSRTGPRSRRGRVPASVADVPARRTSAP